MTSAPTLRRLFAVTAMVTLLAGLLTGLGATARADTSPPPGDPETLTATPLTTWQTNGTVWSMAIVNGVTYVGGNFTSVRPPGSALGQNEVERRHLAAFDTKTGDLLPWAPKLTSPAQTFTGTPDANCNSLGGTQYECASVWSVRPSPDKTMLYVGGAFQFVDGKARSFVAAFNLPSGTLNTTFKPQMNGRVYAIAPTNSNVYLGGSFTKAAGQLRTRLAAVTKANALLPWAPTADGQVTSLAMTPDESRVVVGGRFNQLNASARRGVGAIYTADGTRAPWAGNQIDPAAYTTSLTMVDNLVYLTGDAQGSVSEGIQAVDPYTGTTVWNDACRGASHSMAVVRGVVYAGSHAHDCGGMVDGFGEQYQGYTLADGNRYKLRAEVPFGDGRAKLLHWFPHTNDGNGPRAMATDGNTLWIGGEFTLINDNLNQQGLTRFTFKDQGGVNMAPLRPTGVTVGAETPERVDITWPATPDRDNRALTYQVIKNDNVNNPIATVTSDGRPWLQPWLSVVDTNVTPGSTPSYTIRAIDPDGRQSVRSYPVSVTVPSSDVVAKDLPKAAGAATNYRFEEAVGASTLSSTVGGRTATVGTKAALGGAGALGNSLTLTGMSGSAVVDKLQGYAKRQATVEAMFKTTSTTGGTLLSVGSSNSTTALASNARNILYMSNDGRLNWGFKPDNWTFPTGPSTGFRAVTTSAGYNDGQWHHVAATFEPGTGARIFVDGAMVAEAPTLNWSRSLNSYFRIGGDTTVGYPNRPSSDWWKGSVDEVAAYDYPLTSRQVKGHADALLGRPSAPTGLAGTSANDNTVDLTWNASSGATSYNVLRNGTKVGTATEPAFTDTGLAANKEYTYSVVAANNLGTGGESKSITVKTKAKAPVVVLAKGSAWKYDVSGTETSGWTGADFDDSSWAAGPTEIGHGEGDEATAITPFMPNGTTRRITTYVRSTFDVADLSAVQKLDMQLKRDDGVVIYLNGDEVYRDNMPTGPITAETLSTTYAADDGQTFRTATLPVSALVEGQNTISVEIHQNARSSLDLSFDMELSTLF